MGSIGSSVDFPRVPRPDPFWGRLVLGVFAAINLLAYLLARWMAAAAVLVVFSGCAISSQGIVVGDAKITRCVESLERREIVCTRTEGGHLSEPAIALLRGAVTSVRTILGVP